MAFRLLTASFLMACVGVAQANFSWDGSLEVEHRYFWDDAAETEFSSDQTSARLQFEVFNDWNNGDDQITFEPFFRLDSEDDERTHGDIRQLIWTHLGKNWEVSAGIGRVFWGVTESQHLVDIINQTDGVENIDGEDKLGQPMLRYQYFNDYGTFEAFALPYFRPRTFPGEDSRLNGGIVINPDQELYQSRNKENHADLALRYSHTVGDWGIGLSWFHGTSRDPDLQRFFDPRTFTTTPYYAQMDQFGTDLQLTTGGWLVKLEAIKRSYSDSLIEDFAAVTVGAEYTFVGIFGSVYDLGALAEYSWDERKLRATSPFQNDAFVGARFVFNDVSDSQILLGFTNDLDDSSTKGIFAEAATRIGSSLTANIEMRYFDSDNPRDIFFGLRDDSFIQIGLEYYFD